MFHKIFSQTRRSAVCLKPTASVENISLNRKMVLGYCRSHDTILILFHIDEFKEKTVRLY